MATKRIICRDHGGIFTIQAKRGRQPVRCKPEFLCDRAEQSEPEQMTSHVREVAGVGKVAFVSTQKNRTQTVSKPLPANNPSFPLAMSAKTLLEAVGWVVKGKAWLGDGNETDGFGAWAEIVASREQETLVIKWCNGKLMDQQYLMEFRKPSMNGYPENQLSFVPDELTDSELVRMVRGMKVTWWNTIANSTETAVVGGNVTVEHIFFASGDEDNTKRIVKFLDHGGGGFRAFHVSALLKVG